MTQQFYRRGQPDPEFQRGDEVLCQIEDSAGKPHVFRGQVNTLFWDRHEKTYRYCCLAVRDGDPGFMAAESMLSSAVDESASAEGVVTVG